MLCEACTLTYFASVGIYSKYTQKKSKPKANINKPGLVTWKEKELQTKIEKNVCRSGGS